MKRLVRLAIVLALILGAGFHIFYWYWPRERAGVPEPGSYGARLLASGAYGACLWLPYPHQNLGVLSSALGDGSAFLAAIGREAGSPSPSLPAFGPFTVPPSREIVACSDFDGGRFLLVARVYPGLAAVARLAGTMAGNPWLKGGSVREARGHGDEVQERVLQISWQDGLWMVRSGPVPQLPAAGGPSPPISPISPISTSPESLGILRLTREVAELPAGEYRLARREGDLEVTLASGEAPEPEVALGTDIANAADAPVLLAVTGPDWPAEATRPLPPAAMALFDVQGGLKIGPIELPGGAVLNPPGGSRWALPAKGLAGLLTDSLPRGNAAGWDIVAFDTESLARAEALAPRISALVPPDGAGADGRLVLGAWLRPGPALLRLHEMRKGLEKVPLVDPRQVERWRDWEELLGPFASCSRLSLVSTRSPATFRLRLHGCR